jgi:mannose-6-phosphate isomerase
MEPRAPLRFRPVYQTVVWGGRRMARYRSSLPEGPIGESWDLSDHERGMSVAMDGAFEGLTLRQLTERYGSALVGAGFAGGTFPLMVKLIDAQDRLSVQVHPDDRLAQEMCVGRNGKTECWYLLEDGGELFQGTRPGVTRAGFEAALADGSLPSTLNQFPVKAGDFFYLAARTVHALGAGCLLYEVQQTSDCTFRVYDWGRVGLDGKPRPLHVAESLATIDFARTGFGPLRPSWEGAPGQQSRTLADGPYFKLTEHQLQQPSSFKTNDTGTVIICTAGEVAVATSDGSLTLGPMQTALVPAAAASFEARPRDGATLLVAQPRF